MSYVTKVSLEVSCLILVEGKSDKDFIEALITYINADVRVDSPICSVDTCELMQGKDDLKHKLTGIKREAKKKSIKKIGIILDANSVGVNKRKEEIKNKINELDSSILDELKLFLQAL